MVRVVCIRNSTPGRFRCAARNRCVGGTHDKAVVGVLVGGSILRVVLPAAGGMAFFVPATHVPQQDPAEGHGGKAEKDAGALVLGEGDPRQASQNGKP